MKVILVNTLGMLLLSAACGDQPTQTPISPGSSPVATSNQARTNSLSSPAPSTRDSGDITPEVQKVIAHVLGLKPEEVDANTPLSKLKKPADELDVVEIIMGVEERFGVEIRDDELGGSDLHAVTNITANQISEIVASRRKRK